MSKKDYVLRLLNALEQKWAMARWLKLLIENNHLDDSTIDALQEFFAEAIKLELNEEAQKSLLRSQEILQKLRAKEAEHQMTESDLDQLLADI